MPIDSAAAARDLLRDLTRARIEFYSARVLNALQRAEADAAKLQIELWVAVSKVANGQLTPVTSLDVADMNDVFNSRGYT